MDDNTSNINQNDTQNANQQMPVIPQELRAYFEDIINIAKIPVWDDASKEQVMLDLFVRLDKFLIIKTGENMSEEDGSILLQMDKEGKSQEELQEFIKSHVPNAEEVYGKALVDFRDFYLSAQENFSDVQKAGNPS